MLFIIISVLCIALDIVSKHIISSNMFIGESIPLIKNVFHITYVLNDGAAFSMLQGKTLFLIIITVAIILAALIYLFIKKPKDKLLLLSVTLILSGAIGNLIDRITMGHVVDFLDFRLINFAVFNVADCYVTIGAILLCIYELKASRNGGDEDGE
ncbi:MAG: signal peptidase II [Clostridia bacterium]|nr:signal peptidase II [Clostridia bacterium]